MADLQFTYALGESDSISSNTRSYEDGRTAVVQQYDAPSMIIPTRYRRIAAVADIEGSVSAMIIYGSQPRYRGQRRRAVRAWNHGYDNALPEMRALFIANGPAFAAGKRLALFDNVDIAPLLRDPLGLPTDAGLDGTDTAFRSVLRQKVKP